MGRDAPAASTIDKKGVKSVGIRSTGAEKEHLTILLAVSLEGEKLPALIVLNGKGKKTLQTTYTWRIVINHGWTLTWWSFGFAIFWPNGSVRLQTAKRASLFWIITSLIETKKSSGWLKDATSTSFSYPQTRRLISNHLMLEWIARSKITITDYGFMDWQQEIRG